MVSQPPQSDGRERVALDLMQAIAADELDFPSVKAEREENPRRYWLRLYRQCLSVVSGAAADDAGPSS